MQVAKHSPLSPVGPYSSDALIEGDMQPTPASDDDAMAYVAMRPSRSSGARGSRSRKTETIFSAQAERKASGDRILRATKRRGGEREDGAAFSHGKLVDHDKIREK